MDSSQKGSGLVCALSNDFTNVVVCDEVHGFKTPEKTANLGNLYKLIPEFTAQIQERDTMSVKAIRHMIFQARAGLYTTINKVSPKTH